MRKEDKRNKNTKLKLANAFKKLAKEKPINKITVNDLVTYCHVNRNTFYYHFEDIYALISFIFNDEVAKIMDSFSTNSLEEFLNDIFLYVEKNKHLISSVYNTFGRDQLKKVVYPYFYKTLNTLITNDMQDLNIDACSGFKDFVIDFYSEGVASSIINYFRENKIANKEEIIKYLLTLHSIVPLIVKKKLSEEKSGI
ncbi:MAG: TetR/AcrR family transcriptional regulator C-terminal domain-containing protein [bacterium]|nr:TetR/AcrR family transcriptional regulator C-terminal domain-containing protein [bacterium]